MGMRWLWFVFCSLALPLWAQPPSTVATPAPAAPTAAEKWGLFVTETFAPITFGAVVFNSAISQATGSAPDYGHTLSAYPPRLGAAAGDIMSQNFFGDFVLASAFHEDTRYVRRGPAYGFASRFGYAVSRSVVTHANSGAPTFNWSNVVGSAMSAGLSNAYYPPVNRTASVTLTSWATDIAGSGFANLFPEFWPDFRTWVGRRLRRGR